jgi:hypothetical protein
MSLIGKLRELLTGEPQDPEKKAEWAAEKARIEAEKLETKSQAMSDLPKYKPPERARRPHKKSVRDRSRAQPGGRSRGAQVRSGERVERQGARSGKAST